MFCCYRLEPRGASPARWIAVFKHTTRVVTFARLFLCSLAVLLLARGSAAELPAGFIEQEVGSGWNEPVGIAFDPATANRAYVWERGGKVWIVEDGVKLGPPLIDLSDEVGAWRDYGLLGFALHPNFAQNGHLYLFYVVDRHHLLKAGTPDYDPGTNQYFSATIARITRYTARASDGFRSVESASRRVLVGESAGTGFPLLYQSHGCGQLVFGDDGTLLASCGDGASYDQTDGGSVSTTYYQQALADGIIRAQENVGAFRAQLVDSLSGKVIRIDPETGDGLPSNPFYDSAAPRAARSRVWALGLRNPFRMNLRPETGSHNPADGNPGVIVVGDVGLSNWECLRVIDGPGKNCGWPLFEGLSPLASYQGLTTQNADAPNPLGGFFRFKDLLIEETLGTPSWPNPLDTAQQVPASVPHFMRTRPVLDLGHNPNPPFGPVRVPIFDGDDAATINVGADGAPASGGQFQSLSVTGGAFYDGANFPATYAGTYFFADFSVGWIKNLVFDANHRPTEVRHFASFAGGPVCLAAHSGDGALYYVAFTEQAVRRIVYAPGGNRPPIAVATADVTLGASPLVVNFSSAGSSDPDGQALTFAWDFGDGTTSAEANPVKTFTTAETQRFDVTLTVTDTASATAQAAVKVFINHTLPEVTLLSPLDGAKYPLDADSQFALERSVVEAAGHPTTTRWQVFLHHNTHIHPEPPIDAASTSVTISPVHSETEVFFYRIALTVTDDLGASVQREARLYPAVDTVLPPEWQFTDIGAVPDFGFVNYRDGTFSVGGEGKGIGAVKDALSFVSQPWTGDGEIIARVAAIDSASAFAAVMFREKLNAGSRFALLKLGETQAVFQWRTRPGIPALQRVHAGVVTPPRWLRLVRHGLRCTASLSADGVQWEQVGTVALPMARTIYVGVASFATVAGDSVKADFDHVVVRNLAAPSAPSVEITSPIDGATFSTPVTIAIAASATDPDGGVARVELFNGATKLAIDSAAPFRFTWPGVKAGSYSLTARAVDFSGQKTASAPIAITVAPPATTLPAPWLTRDLGPTHAAGSAMEAAGVFTLTSAEIGLGTTSDRLRVVHRPVAGDATIIARLASLDGAPAAHAGIAFRESFAANARHASLTITGESGACFHTRTAPGLKSTQLASPALAAPQWLKLVRRGASITAFTSPDGVTWTRLGARTVPLASTCHLMLFTGAADATQPATAVFDTITLTRP